MIIMFILTSDYDLHIKRNTYMHTCSLIFTHPYSKPMYHITGPACVFITCFALTSRRWGESEAFLLPSPSLRHQRIIHSFPIRFLNLKFPPPRSLLVWFPFPFFFFFGEGCNLFFSSPDLSLLFLADIS